MRFRMLVPLVALLCLWAAALAEPARVETPGGPVNMRKKQNAQSTVVAAVPNHSLVEAGESDGAWTQITWQKKTGYVKNEFLVRSSDRVGQTLYPASGQEVIVYAAPDAQAAIAAVFNADEPLTAQTVEEGWARVEIDGQAGYLLAETLLQCGDVPGEKLPWSPEPAVTAEDCALTRGGETVTLPAGTAVTVCRVPEKSELCLVRTPLGWGYAPKAVLCLSAYDDADVALVGAIAPAEAVQKAEAALKKAYKAFAKQRLYCVVARHNAAAYRCAFFSDEDQHLYSAVVDAAGAVLCQSDFTAFAAPRAVSALLPEGQMDVTLSADALAVGEVLDIAVAAWTDHQCQYELAGPLPAKSEPGAHFSAAWRPRQAGEYTLTVTVTDAAGKAVSQARQITVTPGGAERLLDLYSQKDGWWLEVPYRDSTLDHSGCAIFTLSHALTRMGKSGDDLLPQNLAKTYALCLTPDGTNNERLIREAAAVYGYKTQGTLISDEKQLKKLFDQGAMFSFSIARGHIALALSLSEDGSMVRVVDSAPGATFTRIVNDSLYYRMRSGSFRAALRMEDLPGARWYFETGEYGGLEYWLRLSYVARRGARLILPQ